MTEPRRLRTQAERDADGTTWRPDDEPRCTLTATSTCLCTSRAGCPVRGEETDDEYDA